MASPLAQFTIKGKKILGAGANYYALLKAKNIPKPSEPLIFIKPSTSYIRGGQNVVIPKGFMVNEEIELGVIIGKKGKHIKESEALDYIGGYCAALDMTAMSFLNEARSKGSPWELGKGFDTACPVSEFISKEKIPDPHNVEVWCKVNGEQRQNGNTKDLIFNVPYLISYISKFMTLEPNDLILTGSPPGMSQVVPNDKIEGGIKNIVSFTVGVTAE